MEPVSPDRLANEAGLTEHGAPVYFSISETELSIGDAIQERTLHEKALQRYQELFSKALQGGFNFKPDDP